MTDDGTAAPASSRRHVRYSPLADQFADPEPIFSQLRELVRSGDFTLGRPVGEFEASFADLVGTRYAVGVGSGTDALKLPLRALGVGHGDEVITSANTFWATAGAICELGARPVFVDCDERMCIDVAQVEAAITPRTKALMPVHLAGDVCEMPELMAIAQRRGIPVVEDACQSLLGEIDGRRAGSFGAAGAFSMHPLKLINVWGDAGVVITDDPAMDRQLRLLRNHGLRDRDEMEILGYNSRLDSVQAIVGLHMVPQARRIAAARAERARYYDDGFREAAGVRIPPRSARTKHVYLLYVLFAERRDALLRFCVERGIEAKVHYPIPLYRQEALRSLGYAAGAFPVTDRHARECITFPVDQYLSREDQDHVIGTVREFYAQAGA